MITKLSEIKQIANDIVTDLKKYKNTKSATWVILKELTNWAIDSLTKKKGVAKFKPEVHDREDNAKELIDEINILINYCDALIERGEDDNPKLVHHCRHWLLNKILPHYNASKRKHDIRDKSKYSLAVLLLPHIAKLHGIHTNDLAKAANIIGEQCQSLVSDLAIIKIKNNKSFKKGSFAKIYKGVAKIDTFELGIIAKVNDESDDTDIEVNILKKLNHPNIVRYICVENNSIILLCEESNFYDFDFDNVEIIRRSEIARDTLKGLAYLHKNGIIHADIKQKNILINKNLQPRITDFGLSIQLINDDVYISNEGFGTPIYTAPEIIREVGKPTMNFCYTTAVDIYAFGVVFLEIYTNKAYELQYHHHKYIISYRLMVMNPLLPPAMEQVYVDILNDCWQEKAGDRPTASDLIVRFNKIISGSDTDSSSSVSTTSSHEC